MNNEIRNTIELVSIEMKSENFENATFMLTNAISNYPNIPKLWQLLGNSKIRDILKNLIKNKNSYTVIIQASLDCYLKALELSNINEYENLKEEINDFLQERKDRGFTNIRNLKEYAEKLRSSAMAHGFGSWINMNNYNYFDGGATQLIIGQNNFNQSQNYANEYQWKVEEINVYENILNELNGLQKVFNKKVDYLMEVNQSIELKTSDSQSKSLFSQEFNKYLDPELKAKLKNGTIDNLTEEEMKKISHAAIGAFVMSKMNKK